MLPEWQYPVTWAVGDSLNAATLNSRVRDQNILLLRRPLFAAHIASAVTAASGTTVLTWDTVDIDDDGMCASGAPASELYVMRDGTYSFWLTVTGTGNGSACPTFYAGLILNGTLRKWGTATGMTAVSGVKYTQQATGTLLLSAGDTFHAWVNQNSGANMTLPALDNTPRLVVMWLGAE
jgi:hypothetical protein